MAKLLTVHNAEINTASITIRTLQVEGKQVTMGVFRQLAVEDIVNRKPLYLRGIGWGHVNYLINYNLYEKADIHLVWQKGSELRRCMVRQPRPTYAFDPEPLERDFFYWNDDERRRAAVADHEKKEAARLEQHQRWMKDIEDLNALVAPLFDLPQLFIAV